MRENCTYGSEGGEAKAFPTPITPSRSRILPILMQPRGVDGRDKPGHDGCELQSREESPLSVSYWLPRTALPSSGRRLREKQLYGLISAICALIRRRKISVISPSVYSEI